MRTHLDEPSLQVRSLSVDYSAGARTSEHAHEWCQLVYCLNGGMHCELDTGVWIIPPRRAIWLPPRTRHALVMFGDVKLRTLYLPEKLDDRFKAVSAFNVSGLLHELILRVCQLGALDGRKHTELALQELVEDEIRLSTSELQPLPMPMDARARSVAEKFLDPSSVTPMLLLISDAGLTRRTAERIFSDETGMTPARWYRQARLSVALRYLLSGQSVSSVAEQSGYKSRSAFSKAFLALHGVSPRDVILDSRNS